MVNARPMGEQKSSSLAVAEAALPELGLDQERHLERRRRALVGHAGDADDDAAAGEGVERPAAAPAPPPLYRSGGPRQRSARSPRARCASRSPARASRTRRRSPSSRSTVRAASSIRSTVPTTRLTRASSSERSGRWSARHARAHRDVHEARLVDVVRRSRRRRVTSTSPASIWRLSLRATRLAVERPTDAAAQDERCGPSSSPHRTFSTMISS